LPDRSADGTRIPRGTSAATVGLVDKFPTTGAEA
jgi:hypothetical protein